VSHGVRELSLISRSVERHSPLRSSPR
jgi:hypothetical protein